MSLAPGWDGNLEKITPAVLIGNSYAPGSIPHYFKDRLYSHEVKKLHATDTLVDAIELPAPPSRFEDAKSLIQFAGCGGCHAIRGVSDAMASEDMAGPSLVGVALNEAQIRAAILSPDSFIAVNRRSGQPYPAGVMPANYGEVLTEKEISTIIQWLKGR